MVPSLCQKSLSHFYKHMELSRTTPLWLYSNGEAERQSHLLLKSLQIANVEGKNWRTELVTWLVAYRSTPQATSHRVMRGSKLLELRRETVEVPREEVQDRD